MSREHLIEAYSRIRPYVRKTPILTSRYLSRLAGAELFFKCENLQRGGAFKARGACNSILQLKGRSESVCTHSSGNHGSCLALMARELGVKAHVVVPENAPRIKKEAIAANGGIIHLSGNSIGEREAGVREVIAKYGSQLVHPYNDWTTIYGQGTAAMEMHHQLDQPLDCIVVPIGGGGLCSGTLLATKYLNPKVKVYGVEPVLASDALQSLRQGTMQPQMLPIRTIADGLRTSLGDNTFPIIRDNIHDIITVDDHDIIRATILIWQKLKILVETSSATVLACALKHNFNNQRVGLILSGGNVDFDALKPFL